MLGSQLKYYWERLRRYSLAEGNVSLWIELYVSKTHPIPAYLLPLHVMYALSF